jgi:hypothetical protein
MAAAGVWEREAEDFQENNIGNEKLPRKRLKSARFIGISNTPALGLDGSLL